MPKLCCPRNLWRCYMHPVKVPKNEQRKWVDLNGISHDVYKDYECDCGQTHRLNVERNIWNG